MLTGYDDVCGLLETRRLTSCLWFFIERGIAFFGCLVVRELRLGCGGEGEAERVP